MSSSATTLTVFGSCNMDLVAYAATAPERGETVLGREFRTTPGGKGANQAVAAARAGAEVRMIGAVGEDEFGEQLRANLESFGVDTAGLRTEEGRSGTAHIVVDDRGDNSIVVVPGANATVEDLADGDEQRIAESAGLLLQLEIPVAGVRASAEAARRHAVPVVLTPAPAAELPDELLACVDLLVPNEHEAAVLSGQQDPQRALEVLLERVPEVVITLGERGALHGDRSGRSQRIEGYSVPVVDTTAAGDTFAGVLSLARAEGAAAPEALDRAAAAAALSVRRNGASGSMPSRGEIEAFRSGAQALS
jgi:ribokinase